MPKKNSLAPSPKPKPKFTSRNNAALHIGGSVQLIDKLIREGKLTRYKIGDRKVVVSVEQLEALVKAC